MHRRPRFPEGGYVFHVLNRAVGRGIIFEKSGDYAAFEKILRQAWDRFGMRLLCYTLMPNHWHLVLWPERDGTLSPYMQWLTVTHVRRWHAHRHTEGTGPVYQGRFKAFPTEEGNHFLTVCRYVERNALRARLVRRAENWRWSSLWHRVYETAVPWLSPWPVSIPDGWTEHVNSVQTEAELAALRRSVVRGAPFGSPDWQQQTATELGLQATLCPRGRPRLGQGDSTEKET